MITAWKFLITALFGVCLFIGGQAKAETARPADSGLLNYLQGLGPINFSQGGGAFLPLQVLTAMKEGDVSPLMQFVLVNHLMNSAVKEAQKLVPGRRDPFTVASAKFQLGLCKIQKAFQQGMLMALLPALSDKDEYGGSSDPGVRAGSSQQGLMLSQAFQKNENCAGDDNGFDPMMLAMFAKK
jgi:hypothetical protein